MVIGRDIDGAVLKSYRVAIGVLSEGSVVGAGVYRHVQPRRRGRLQHSFTELLLLAVDKDCERRGYGTAIVKAIEAECEAAKSAWLLV